MWLLLRAMGSSWGLLSMLWIYEAILKLRFTYSAVFWGKRVEKKTAQAALKKLRGLVLREATVAVGTTLVAVLEVLLGVRRRKNSNSVQSAKTHYWIEHAHLRIRQEVQD